MRSVLMVCHGNICRSPMAATLMRVMAEAAGWDDALWVDSCGVSDEEEGNPMDRRAVAMLLSHGIRPAPHEARRFSRGDYAMYDDILCMEERNRRGLLRLLGGDPEGKLRLLLDYTDDPHDIEDPWYSGDFEKFALGGKTLETWDPATDGMWTREAPSKYSGLKDWTSNLFDNM